MNILVDTSVCVGHFKLAALLEQGRVVCHIYVVTEVACETRPNQRAVIAMLADLERTPLATPDEMLELIKRCGLYGCGCCFVDMSPLASALLSDQTLIWTLNKRLESMAAGLNRAYRAALHS